MRPTPRGPMILRQKDAPPFPVNPETSISKEAETNLETVARDDYSGDDLRYMGKTRLEAAILSLAEDATLSADARTEFLDRIMGKPKQRTENLNVNASLSDILRQYAEEDVLEAVEVKVDDDCILE